MLRRFSLVQNYSDRLLYGECLQCQEVSLYIQLIVPMFLIAELLKDESALLSKTCILTTMSNVQMLEKCIRRIFKMFLKSLHIRDIQNSIII
jgi:hypothetical protein